MNHAYVLALTSALLFSGASVIFARFSRSHSSLWMNLVKNSVAGMGFVLASASSMLWFGESWDGTSSLSAGYFFMSGFLGLGVGDWFLFRAYERIGSARALLVYSFQPLLLTIGGFLLFGQSLTGRQAGALLLMMACVWTISFEKFRTEGHWEWRGILFAIIGVILDSTGIILSRKGFDLSPGTSSFTANALRCVASILPFAFLAHFRGEKIWGAFRALGKREKALAAGASFLGTFLSLALWLTALKVGHIGGLAAVGSFNPISAAAWEWILHRKAPTPYFFAALGLFLVGFFLLLQ